MVFDDRDRRVECVHGLRRRSFMRQKAHRTSFQAMVESLKSTAVSLLLKRLLVVLAIEFAVLVATVGYYLGVDSAQADVFLVVVVAIVLTSLLISVVRSSAGFWTRDRAEVRALLAHGYCIRCLYDLSGLPVEPDGCTVCPECGAAWRVGPLSGAPGQ